MGFFEKLKQGLSKTRNNISVKLETVFGAYKEVDDDFFDELEEALIVADVGALTAGEIIERFRRRVYDEHVHDPQKARELLKDIIVSTLDAPEMVLTPPTVLLIVGVNGVGKTTTIGKLASIYKQRGLSVALCAGDTFRAAAAEQLSIWAQRAGVPIVRGSEGADPASVVFDAATMAKARKVDMLIVDTAGRLQNKANLMRELSKIKKVLDREYAGAQVISLLVLDATTGQNGLMQAKAFSEAADISGVVLTKLDGTAKGGIAIAIKKQMGFPVRFICVGEQIDDLQPFSAREFVEALF